MLWLLTAAFLLAGTADLAAVWLGRATWRYLLKPGTMLLIIALAATALPEAGSYGYLVLAGLLFSLAGDIFLVLPRDHFIAGLSAFFVAHLCYIFAFDSTRAYGGADMGVAIFLIVYGAIFFGDLRKGVVERGGKWLQIPVLLYMVVISTMVLRAFIARQPLIMAGAVLFYISDAILARNRFGKPVHRADVWVMTTYFSAQYLIALSALLH